MRAHFGDTEFSSGIGYGYTRGRFLAVLDLYKSRLRRDNGLMHVVLTALDSSASSAYLILGLILFAGSTLARRLMADPNSQVGDEDMEEGVTVRIRSKKVVPIHRTSTVRQYVAPVNQRVSNY